jgi:hypothetical protein
MVLDHSGDSKVFYHDTLIVLSIGLSRLEMMIAALPLDLEMSLGCATSSLTTACAAFLAPAQGALLTPKCTMRSAIETWILYRVALTIGQKGLKSHIKTDVWMRTVNGRMLGLWPCLTDNEGIPVPVSTVYKMYGLRSTLYWTMQLDLEEVSSLLGDNQVFLVFVQVHIFAVLSQLDRVPAVGLLEAWKADTGESILFGSEKALEGFRQAISKHLHRSRWYMLTLPFELRFQVILCGECSILLILRLDGREHPVVNGARLAQASDEQARLCFSWIQTVFKCSHGHFLPDSIRMCQVPPVGGQQFTHVAEASGHLAPIQVGST